MTPDTLIIQNIGLVNATCNACDVARCFFRHPKILVGYECKHPDAKVGEAARFLYGHRICNRKTDNTNGDLLSQSTQESR